MGGGNSLYDVGARISGVMLASFGINAFLLARYGLKGLFDLTRPWRMAIFLGASFAGLYGGYRSALLLQVALVGVQFLVEGLWRSRYMFVTLAVALVVSMGLVATADKLPLAVQRAISFLPLNVNPTVELSRAASTEWRLEIWRRMLPEVPKYLFKGKATIWTPQNWQRLRIFHSGDE